MNQVEKYTPQQVAQAGPSPAQMLNAIIEKGVTSENVQAIEKLAELSWKFEERDAERQFNAAFVELQNNLPVIVAESIIPNRGKYQRFEDLMQKDGIGKLLAKHGFSVSFTQEIDANRVVVTCHLSHIGGHSRKNSIAVRVSGKADSETQADMKATTTAKRNALIQALNLVIRQDVLNEENDASIEGDPNEFVTQEQADQLEHRVAMTNSDVLAFLKFCNAKKFTEIPASKYDEADRLLKRKETQGR